VLLSAMAVELVISIESLLTKAAFGMSLEARLVHGPWVVVSELLMFPQVTKCEQLVLVGEDFLVPCT
jgi:hypothetical protein